MDSPSESSVGINAARGGFSVGLNATAQDADGSERTIALGTVEVRIRDVGVDVLLTIPEGARMVSATANDRGALTHFAFAPDMADRK